MRRCDAATVVREVWAKIRRPCCICLPSSAAELLDRGFDTSPTHALGSPCKRNAVKDFSDDLCSLADCHSGTIEEQVAIRERHVSFSYRLKVPPPGISLQDILLK